MPLLKPRTFRLALARQLPASDKLNLFLVNTARKTKLGCSRRGKITIPIKYFDETCDQPKVVPACKLTGAHARAISRLRGTAVGGLVGLWKGNGHTETVKSVFVDGASLSALAEVRAIIKQADHRIFPEARDEKIKRRSGEI